MRRRSIGCVLLVTVAAACASAWVTARAADEKPAAASGSATAEAGSARPAAGATGRASTRAAGHLADRVLVISVDGLRPDMLLRCKTPHMHTLFQGGSFTFWAKTTAVSITLPSHTSMLTGVSPRKHGIEWNRTLPLSRPVYPSYPTLFKVAKKAGYSTAMVAGKSKFETLALPNTIDYAAIPENADNVGEWFADGAAATGPTTGPTSKPAIKKVKDSEVADHAVRIIREHKPQVMFVHFPAVDAAGHTKGWGTPDQVAAVEAADEAVGAVLDALDDAGVRKGTAVILSADHGGAGKNHGPEDARARHIPWIINGPGIRRGVDLTTYADLEVRTEDTFATACYLLGIPLAPGLDGHPVMEVLEKRGDLLHETSKP